LRSRGTKRTQVYSTINAVVTFGADQLAKLESAQNCSFESIDINDVKSDPFAEARGSLCSELPINKKTGEASASACAMMAGSESITVGPEKFDMVGPEIAKALRNNGVKEVTIRAAASGNHVEAQLKQPATVPQDMKTDGCYQLDVGKKFSADISRGADGTITIENIEGLTAKIDNILRTRKVDAVVHKIVISKAADGTTQVETTGSRLGVESTRTKFKEPSVYKDLKEAMDRVEAEKTRKGIAPKRQSSALELPAIYVG
jgi:hypothetical protein